MEAEPINPSTPSTVRCVHPGKEDPRRFNILVVGESGIGKTTFLNTVFKAYTEKDCSVVRTDRTDDIVEVGRFYVKSDGNASDFDVTLFDSPGYGDLVDNQVYIDTLCNFVSERHSRWLALENDLSEAERLIRDDRVHCVIHFIAPHRLKRLDISCMRQLHCLAPTVPVVAKADSMTPDERRKFLEYAHEKLNEFSISSPFGLCNLAGENSDSGKDSAGSESIACDDEIEDEVIYPSLPAGSPLTSSDESPWIPPIKTSTTSSINVPTANEKRSNATLSNVESSHQSDMPVPGGNHSPESSKFTDGQVTLFCVVSDPSFHRVYPWGTCEVENEEHSDLMQLQRILFEGGYMRRLVRITDKMTLSLRNPNTPVLSNLLSFYRYLCSPSKSIRLKCDDDVSAVWIFILIGLMCICFGLIALQTSRDSVSTEQGAILRAMLHNELSLGMGRGFCHE